MLPCRNAREMLAFLTATSMCLFQVRFFLALVTPSWTQWRWYSESTGLCLLVIWRTSHFDGLKSMFYFLSHSSSADRSAWSAAVSSGDATGQCSRVLSAKRPVSEDTHSGRSLMYTRKSRGPKTLPCWTPDRTGALSEFTPSTTALWCRSGRVWGVGIS